MLRDFKFLRRNSHSSKNPNSEEIENVPLNPRHSLGLQISSDPSRPPLNTIQEPKGHVEQEGGGRGAKIDRTPTKPKGRYSDSTMPLRTPEKHGHLFKNRFGWAQKGDTSSNNGEVREEGRSEVSSNAGISRTMGNMITTPRSTRTVGRGNSSYSECTSTQSTPTKSVSKPPNPGFCLASGGSRALVNGGARTANFTALAKGAPISFNSSTVVNTVEVPHFELKEDPAFWMEHSVQVLIRVRPLNNMEKSSNGFNRCLKQESAQCITWIGQPETRFTFDHVACETIDQETLFRVVGLPIVENCLSGYNSCMFAYGQTGSGKTYTMLGDTEELEVRPSQNRGLTPRIFEFLFARIRAEEESRKDERLKYNCKCSFLEIYNEQITDLLDPSSTNLLLREDIKNGVYVENLSEFEVQSVGDILKLLSQGSSNRKVAATNMNSESSRSHSVFTCVIESSWEKDSTSNFRFARLNLVDLAGSERQKTSGAEGERLKEAANINKSLSTLGHVIMVLVDVAHGKPKHVPYRDSRLTFLLQDSLGGNSKTTIIANISPSVCCAAETLNTLKFAQRVKLIQNNAVVNEDSSGDVVALQHQIRLLKKELSAIKCQNVSRALSFGPKTVGDSKEEEDSYYTGKASQMDQQDNFLEKQSDCILRLSSKQLKSLETTLSGAFRREQMAETAIQQLEAEIEQLNRLARQREEDTRCTKMMLKFREDKIQRMESLLGGLMPTDTYLVEENNALSEEIQLLRAKVDKNPEVTRFALENIRLLEQLRRFQDFYEEGERELLLAEVSELRNQLTLFLDGSLKQQNQLDLNLPSHVIDLGKENDLLRLKLKETLHELEESRDNLNCCLEKNARLRREIDDLRVSLTQNVAASHDADSNEVIKESNLGARTYDHQSMKTFHDEKREMKVEFLKKEHSEKVLDLQLELDILKIILREEKSYRCEAEERAQILNRDLELSKEKILLVNNQYADIQAELAQANSVIEALESQQILLIEEIEDLKKSNSHYGELMHNQDLEISSLKEQLRCHESRDLSFTKSSESEASPLQAKLRKMHDSLEKAKQLNQRYQTDLAFQESNEEEMDEIRRQVEAETAEVIVCLQEELAVLQQEVQDSKLKEMETRERLALVQVEMEKLEEKLYLTSQDNQKLDETLEDKDQQLEKHFEEWKVLTSEIESILAGGDESLQDAADQLDVISSPFSHKESWVSQQFERVRKYITEKELIIDELNQWLEDALNRRNDMECMLRSLRGAALVMTEAHQQECSERDKEILLLTSELSAKTLALTNLEKMIKHGEDKLRKTSDCAVVAFLVVKRLSESNSSHLEKLNNMGLEIQELTERNMQKNAVLLSQVSAIDEAEKQIESLKVELQEVEDRYITQRLQFSEEQECATSEEAKVEDEENKILRTKEKLAELKTGISTVRSCMNDYEKSIGSPEKANASGSMAYTPADKKYETQTGTQEEGVDHIVQCVVDDEKTKYTSLSFEVARSLNQSVSNQKRLVCERVSKDEKDRNATIILLKKEIESALGSLKGVQSEMARLRDEKQEAWVSDKESQERIKSLTTQVSALQIAVDRFKEDFDLKMDDLDEKLQVVEKLVEQSSNSWIQQKELLEAELSDANVLANQKTTEASCILAKFEEAQDTMKEADIMINELMIANEALKLDKKDLKKKELNLSNEKEALTNEVESLQAANSLKDLHCEKLEIQFEADLLAMKTLIMELENMVAEIQNTSTEDWMFVSSEVLDLKSQCFRSTELVRSWLEVIWSEIITKDCALSVLHLCHLGILLETATGLHAENGLLHHGLCESNSVVSELREHNIKSRRELEMCRMVKGKLLTDIKNSFDRISRKEHETEELTIKLTSFDKKILDLQVQEEFMLQRSNHIGSELSALMKELYLSNRNVLASLLEQEILLKEKEELWNSQEENLLMEQTSKDFQLLILLMELEETNALNAGIKRALTQNFEVLENFKKNIVIRSVDAAISELILLEDEVEFSVVKQEAKEAEREKQDLLLQLKERDSTIAQMGMLKEALEQDIESLYKVAHSTDSLKHDLGEVMEAKALLSSHVQKLASDYEKLSEEMKMKESALELSSGRISVLDEKNQLLQKDICFLAKESSRLQNELETKDSALGKLSCLEEENMGLQDAVKELKAKNHALLQELEDKKAEVETYSKGTNIFDTENHRLREKVSLLVNRIADFQTGLDDACSQILNMFSEKSVAVDDILQRICDDVERTSKITEDLESLENLATELVSENISLQNELLRKDDILKGLLFDLSLLQESTSNSMDQKSEIEQLEDSLNAQENEFELKCRELDEAVSKSQMLEAQLLEKLSSISALELDISKERETIKFVSSQNVELVAGIENALQAKKLVEEELAETKEAKDNLEMQLAKMDVSLGEMANSIESLESNLAVVTEEREDLTGRILTLKKELEMAQALAEENEAIAVEAQEIAEAKRIHAENKEEEVKLLERSVEELECTVNVLENKVEIIKGEAERQRLQREELELELHAVKQQMQNLKSSDADVKRFLDKKEKHLQEAFQRIEILEREISAKEVEISQCKAHISELYLHAEAQASEYKQKFKALEAMAEQVKQDVPASHSTNSSSSKLEKNPSKSRGSSSPFKCIGGLVQQIKSEREEELSAGRYRIEELEALAASRQKEIFMLNARLAAAESMTHDVIRDLLGLKLDMNSYATLLDNQQVQMLTEKARLQNVESQVKEQEISKLKQQLSEFIQERKGWLEEIGRKQAEMVTAQVSLEKLRQRDRLLSAENDMLKVENVKALSKFHINHIKMENTTNKKRVMELEAEVKKLSGQQNLQQRIHHHAKIKEENNALKSQNDDLSLKLRRTEAILSRVREELAQFRQANGRCPYVNFDEEQRLGDKLKEVEEEKVQLAQKLLSLCTSILKVAGITRTKSEISPPVAEEALEQLKDRIYSLEREVQDEKFKNKMANERIRLSEIMPKSSPMSSRADDNCRTPNRVSSFLSPLDR